MKFKTVDEMLADYQMFNFDEAFTDNELLHIKKMIIDYADQFKQSIKEVEYEKNNFAISFAAWLKGAEGKMYEATGMSAYTLLEMYKNRPFIDTINTQKQ